VNSYFRNIDFRATSLLSILVHPVFIFLLLSIIFAYPIFNGITNLGILDWDQHFLYHAVPRETILRYHQFPLWNPYYCGGNVMLANTQARFTSPTFLLVLLFGTVVGLKLEIWLHLFLGMLGMYLLSREIGIGKFSAYLPPIIFMFSSMYVFHLTVGHTWFMAIAYLPYVLLFYLKGLSKIEYGIIAGGFIALMILEGGIYPFPHTILFLGIFSVLISLKNLTIKPLKVFTIIIVFTLIFSAIKLIPTLEFFAKFPRLIESKDHLSFKIVYYILLSRTQNINIKYPNQLLYGWWEYGSYVGFLAIIIWLIGSIISFKKHFPLIFTGLVFFVLALGNFSGFAPWHLLHKAPVFRSHHAPSRLMIGFVFSLSLITGICLTKLEKHSFRNSHLNKIISLFCVLVIAIITIDLISVNSKIFASAFPTSPPSIKRNANYQQIWGDHHDMYPAFLRNQGTLNAYEPTHFPIKAIPKTDPNYKGEAFLTGKGEAEIIYWSPNEIIVNIEPESDGYLVLNQNYAPNWKAANKKQVESYNGLISAKINLKDKGIRFYYMPVSFIIGSIISLAGIIFAIMKLIWRRSKFKLCLSNFLIA